ncbi:MAG: hypothetical protein ACRCUY_08450 [Thermoguttaceae bacterium]
MLRLLFCICSFSILLTVVSHFVSALWAGEGAPSEEAVPNWQLRHSENNGKCRTIKHTLSPNEIPVAELEVDLPENSSVVIGYPLSFPLLIDETSPSVQIKSNMPGIVLAAQVVLPNTIHPATGKPVTFLVAGSKHSGSGQWETLDFSSHQFAGRQLAERQFSSVQSQQNNVILSDKSSQFMGTQSTLQQQSERVSGFLRAEMKQQLDTRGKYIRQLILFIEPVPNQPKQTTIWVEAPQLEGKITAHLEMVNQFETDKNGDYLYQFDPVNFIGFKLENSHETYFLHEIRSNMQGNETRWTSQAISGIPEPLKANVSMKYEQHSPQTEQTLYEKSRMRLFYGAPTSDAKNGITYSMMNYQSNGATSPAALMDIRLSGQNLLVDGMPIGVRAIEYQGEPLDFLRRLEFNVVWVRGRATAELLQEAKEAGVWIICEPPGPAELERAKKFEPTANQSGIRAAYLNTPLLDSLYDNVLAWNLGDECSAPGYAENAQWASVLQNADQGRRRPLLCTARSGVREYSRIANVLMMPREPLFSSLEMRDLERWQKDYPSLARPDTPFWGTIQTQPSTKLATQWMLYGGNAEEICPISYEQLQMQVFQGLAAGVHGFLFTSNTPLTNNDPETEFRRTALELINLELQLIEEWFAGGQVQSALVNAKRGKMSSVLLQSGRSRLLVPLWHEQLSQQAIGAAVVGPVEYVVPGIPETYSAFHLVPGRLFPLDSKRVAGGMQLELEEANLNSLIFFGEVDTIYAQVGERAKQMGPRAAALACHLATLHLASTKNVLTALKTAKETNSIPVHPKDKLPLVSVTEQETMLRTTKEAIDLANNLAQRNPPDYARSFLQAERSTRGLRVVARDMLREATRYELNSGMTPVSVSFATLPLYIGAYQRANQAQLGPNRLPGGDMEDINQMLATRWEARRHRIEGVATPTCETVSNAAHSGRSGLRMTVSPMNLEDKPTQLETAPLWISSPPIPVQMGEMICVHGWIRIPKPLESTVDGLTIFDSLGGESLALRFTQTKGEWREFAFYRNIPQTGDYFVFFALQGFGEIQLDDVQVNAVQFDIPSVVPPQNPPNTPSTWQRLNPFQYLPPLPQLPLIPGRN